MTAMRICVYCASSEHCARVYHDAANALGRTLAETGATIVYGGGATGLMGALADGADGRNGEDDVDGAGHGVSCKRMGWID